MTELMTMKRLFSAFVFLFIDQTAAFALDSTPIIRVDAAYHSGPVFGVEPLMNDQRLATISHDKTVKIWRSRDFKLLQTLRIPIGNAFEGNLDSIAVSPDSKLIAVGGWTCWERGKHGCVYLFDATTGHLLRCIDQLKNIIGELRFSPDGRVLAIGLHGNGGIAFVDTQTFQILAQDQDYGERVTGLSFSSNGYAATGSNDGYLRVYDPQFKLAARVKVPEVDRIADSYFSPDGKRLLVSSYNSPLIQILSLPQLQVERSLRVDASHPIKTLRNAVWSPSGEFIYGSGDSANVQEAEILRWKVSDLSHYESIKLSHRVQSIRPRSQNGIAFSTENAAIGLLADNETRPRLSDTHTLQHPQMHDGFQVSFDGSKVSFPITQPVKESLFFSVDQLSLEKETANFKQAASRKPNKNLQLADWENAAKPKLNGHPLELEPFEIVRSYASSTKNTHLFLGTEWSLKSFDKKGRLAWNTAMPGAVWNLAATGDGSLVVAALSDGTIRWYRAADGKEMQALFVEPHSKEWVLWRPDGYYASSENGDNLIGWHVNRGKNSAPDFYRAVQFERQFYRPDLLRSSLGASAGSAKEDWIARSEPKRSGVSTRYAGVLANGSRGTIDTIRLGEFTLRKL
ncbi:WD40 repeat domain-containing protein [Methylomicrobium album]|uniref:WD40 repeat domain-containing protein n=1 Tax=Methylomicrobium album TaxID=39775 RepID=UPI00020D88F9|nr:hypothetical protein [Methylomicrobium album]